MNLQRRIAETRQESLARSVDRRAGFPRWFGRARAQADHDAAALRPVHEDFAHAIRF